MRKRKYSVEFKYEVVKMVLESKRPSDIARQYKMNSRIIYRWISEYRQGKYNMTMNNK
jgi:transposase-like protein